MAKLSEFGLDNPLDTKRVHPLKVSWWTSMVLGSVFVIAAIGAGWIVFKWAWGKASGALANTGVKVPGLSFQSAPGKSTPPPSSPGLQVYS